MPFGVRNYYWPVDVSAIHLHAILVFLRLEVRRMVLKTETPVIDFKG
jgi:hypothetical protein